MKNRIVTRDIPRYITRSLGNNDLEVLLRPLGRPFVSECGWIRRTWHEYILSKALGLLKQQFYEKTKRAFSPHPLSDHHVDEGFKIWKKIMLY